MRRALLAAVLAVALAAVPAAGLVAGPTDGGGASAAAPAKVSIVDVTVDPSTPQPGEQVVITPTVKVLAASDSDFEFTDIALRMPSGNRLREYTRVEDLGTLAPGSELSVPMIVSFDEPGLHRFRVHAYGESDGENVHVQYPVVVEVKQAGQAPQIDVTVEPRVANADSVANVTVSNGVGTELRNLELTLDGEDVRVDRRRRVLPVLADGESETFQFPVSATRNGTHTLNASVRYSRDDDVRTLTESAAVRFESLAEDVLVDATAADDGRSVAVDVTNRGNVALESVLVSENADGVDAPSRSLGTIGVDETRTVRLNVSRTGDAEDDVDVPVSVAYDVGDRSGTANATATLSTVPGAIELTGLDVSQEDGSVHISGSASNVGLTGVDGVVVRVRSASDVEPAYPQKEFFVGEVPPNEFKAFDLYANVLTPDASEIELEVTYLTDGSQQRKVVAVDYAGGETIGTDTGGGLSDLLPLVLTGLGVGVVGSLVYRGWRNRDAGG